MREKERELSAGGVMCMSPSQVKQALDKLEKDAERRNAMSALKHCVETMDAASVPRFLTQVSETREKGSSRAYAISLYEDVARVHGSLIVPHIPRVMCTLTRTLSSSGSSPQLQQACAKVVSAVAKHAIDDSSPALAAQVLRELSGPLLEVLAGKLEPLATGAALCLQTLVESEKWKFAPDALVEDVCLKTAVALGEKGTRTVAHMQLARALAGANASLLSKYGVALLRAGAEVLRAPPSASWQHRASAARLLTAVLPTVDRATLAEELGATAQALDGCKHDKMSNVRWSVKEALKTAKMLLVKENSRRSSDGDDLLVLLFTASPSSSPRRRSLGGKSDDTSPEQASKTSRGSRSLSPASIISLSPSAPSDSPRLPPVLSQASGRRHHRSPLRATRLHIRVSPSDNSAATAVNSFDSPRKENLPSQNPDTKVSGVFNSDPSPSTTPRSAGKYARPRPQAPGGTFIPYPPSLSDETDGVHRRSTNTETGAGVILKAMAGNSFASPEKLATTVNRNRGQDRMAGFEDAFLFSSVASSDFDTKHEATDQNMGFGEQEQFLTKTSSRDTTPNSGTSRGHGVLDVSTMKHVFELKGPVVGNLGRNAVEQPALGTRNSGENGVFVSPVKNDWKETPKGHSRTPSRDGSPAQLATPSEKSPFSGQSDVLIAADDFLPFSTPRRLVRSLQACYLSPSDSTASNRFVDHDVTKARGDRGEDVTDNLTTIDMDLGTPNSSSTGWSVRTNPIASEDTLKSESDESDSERGRSTWKKMAPHTPPAQEADNPEADESFCRRLIHPAAGLGQEADDSVDMFERNAGDLPPKTYRESLERKDQLLDGVEIIKRTQQDGFASGGENGLRSMPSELSQEGSVGKCCCNQALLPSENAAGAAAGVGEESCRVETCPSFSPSDPCTGKDQISRLNFRDYVSKSWINGRKALFTWQFCVVVIAIPLAMALAKVLFPSDSSFSGYLVPT